MNSYKLKLIVTVLLVAVISCNEPDTLILNVVHPDGSVTRKLEMRNDVNNFKIAEIQVPFDSTWIRKDSVEISDKGDTTWIIRAEKWFANTEEINLSYKNDSGINRIYSRYSDFSKRFRWFNTLYKFSETIERNFKYGYPVRNFLDSDELEWFYSPAENNQIRLAGSDSSKYKALSDSVEKKKEEWFFAAMVSEWVNEFYQLLNEETRSKTGMSVVKDWEARMLKVLRENEMDFDSLWKSGFVLKKCLGEQDALKFKNEADSALAIVEDRFVISFGDYTMQMEMPGSIIASNGFADSSGRLIWPVVYDYFFTEDYIMWAESKVPNIWAWVLSGVFIVFVFTGFLIRRKKKG